MINTALAVGIVAMGLGCLALAGGVLWMHRRPADAHLVYSMIQSVSRFWQDGHDRAKAIYSPDSQNPAPNLDLWTPTEPPEQPEPGEEVPVPGEVEP